MHATGAIGDAHDAVRQHGDVERTVVAGADGDGRSVDGREVGSSTDDAVTRGLASASRADPVELSPNT